MIDRRTALKALLLGGGSLATLAALERAQALRLNPDYVEHDEIPTPSNPPSGKLRVYPKSDKILYQLDSLGVETALVGALFVTGTYTGDDTASHAITGLGFRPKCVMIFHYGTTTDTAGFAYIKTENAYGTLCNEEKPAAFKYTYGIVSLDADGFTVTDQDLHKDPNDYPNQYDFIAIG